MYNSTITSKSECAFGDMTSIIDRFPDLTACSGDLAVESDLASDLAEGGESDPELKLGWWLSIAACILTKKFRYRLFFMKISSVKSFT